jgi:hypothetical protein
MTTRVYDVKKQKNTLNRIIVLILIIVEILLVSRLMNNPSLIDQGFVSTLSMISKVLIIPLKACSAVGLPVQCPLNPSSMLLLLFRWLCMH